MKRVCAWCGTELDGKVSRDDSDQPITHGICEACSTNLWGEVGTPLHTFLESLGIPTLLVTGAVVVDGALGEEGVVGVAGAIVVDGANEKALEMLGKSQDAVGGKPTGQVFDCINADLPGGCGRTVHCSACTLRNVVTQTFTLGEGQIRVPVALEVRLGGSTEEKLFLVTTEKMADRVLVRIEPARDSSTQEGY